MLVRVRVRPHGVATMYDQMFDAYRRASESWMQVQQDMFKTGGQPWMSSANAAGGGPDWNRTLQKRCLELTVELLNRQRESLDTIYKSAIHMLEQTSKISEAKSPEEFRRLVEDAWRELVREHQEPVRDAVPRSADLGGEVAGAGQGRAGLGADIMNNGERSRVAIACQGGGSHTAFTARRPPGPAGEPPGRRRRHRADRNVGRRDLRGARLGRLRPQRQDAGDQEAPAVLGVDVGARADGSDRQSGDAEHR